MNVLADIVASASGNGRPAILGSTSLTYAELAELAWSMAGRLREHGLGPGQLAITAMPQGADNIAAMLAVRLAGAVLVPVNPLATKTELDHIASDSGASLVIAPAVPEPALQGEAIGNLAIAPTGAKHVFTPDPGDELVVYTSGSTGRPKGVVLGSEALSANLAAVSQVIGLGPSDRTLAFTPPQYTLAISQVLSHLKVGGAVLPYSRGMLDPLGMLKSAAAEGITGLQLNPGILHTLMQTLGEDFPALQLRYVVLLGQPVSASFASRVARQLPGAALFNGYGCTENAPRVAMGPISTASTQVEPLDVGTAVPGTEISIRDESGDELPPGSRGEICIRGTSLMRGYLNVDTSDRFFDGWFRTRDLGELDGEGRLRIAGRADNVILVAQEKVSPEDVEERILKTDGVHEAAVCGVNDPTYFQVPVAIVVVDDVAVVSHIRQQLRMALSRSRQPVRYHVVEAVPRTPYGKIDRSAVRRLVDKLEQDRAT